MLGDHAPIIISIHALRVEGDCAGSVSGVSAVPISIHALRVEGDPPLQGRASHSCISIHALRVEGDIAAAVAFVAM